MPRMLVVNCFSSQIPSLIRRALMAVAADMNLHDVRISTTHESLPCRPADIYAVHRTDRESDEYLARLLYDCKHRPVLVYTWPGSAIVYRLERECGGIKLVQLCDARALDHERSRPS